MANLGCAIKYEKKKRKRAHLQKHIYYSNIRITLIVRYVNVGLVSFFRYFQFSRKHFGITVHEIKFLFLTEEN